MQSVWLKKVRILGDRERDSFKSPSYGKRNHDICSESAEQSCHAPIASKVIKFSDGQINLLASYFPFSSVDASIDF